MPSITIIGQGEIGLAVKHVLKKNHPRIACWDVDPKRCPIGMTMEKAVTGADIVFLCIPSWTIAIAAKDLKPCMKKSAIIVLLSKGLDRETGKTVDELLSGVFTQSTVLLSGPMLAEELLANNIGAASIASLSPKARQVIVNIFKRTTLHLVPTNDVHGVSLCGVLKNVYAMGFGMGAALKAGHNWRGWYLQQALSEMRGIVQILGGKAETVDGPAGVGDLMATGSSDGSKNYQYGFAVALKKKPKDLSEGAVSIETLAKKLGAKKKQFPLFCTIQDILARRDSAKVLLDG